MLNAEKYKERIKELDYRFALCNGELKSCKGNRCDECTFYEGSCSCMKHINKWLLEEYKEPILNEDEKKITIEIVGACSDVTYGDKLALKYLPHSKVGFVVKHETVE